MRENFQKMQMEVKNNMEKVQSYQKQWYDKCAKERSFEPGDHDIFLLPTTTSKFTAKWQGPYDVVKRVGKVNSLVHMNDK